MVQTFAGRFGVWPATGTTEWTADDFEAFAPAGAVAAEVRLFITGRGKVWMKGLLVHA